MTRRRNLDKHNHQVGDGSYLLYCINNIPCKRVCNVCRSEVDPGKKLQTQQERNPSPYRHYDYLSIWEVNFE